MKINIVTVLFQLEKWLSAEINPQNYLGLGGGVLSVERGNLSKFGASLALGSLTILLDPLRSRLPSRSH
ncbi:MULTISPECIES: hypothetical protein [Kamptonema]|uniref:hypothetical protein n=1 Tax=Kamptonema TaxID=1501433 RepID=UPI0001DAC635|nr:MULTISPECIES: hypothetical protein [Kamptonema]CBN53768.1 hypothetical protein OSCI_230012 [Kamptonema sp. PCC 6506]